LAAIGASSHRKGRIAELLHRAFALALAAKGTIATLEVLAGLGLFLPLPWTLRRAIDWLTHHEVVQSQGDLMVRVTQDAAEAMMLATQHFFGYYLVAHGGLKLVLIVLLARGIRPAFPVAILALGGFVAYQVYEYTLTGSTALLVMSALDLLTAFLVWRELLALPPALTPALTPALAPPRPAPIPRAEGP